MLNKIIPTVYLILLTVFTLLTGSCGGSGGGAAVDNTVNTPERVTFAGTGTLGIFDPSVTRDPADGRLWMSYSSVESSVFFATNQHIGVGIRLAFSDDKGVTWTDTGIDVVTFSDTTVGPLPSVDTMLNIPAASEGTWQSETSSVVYDPGAPANERWKIIWHQYLIANGISYFVDYSWLAMKMAATPLGLATAPSIKLFGGLALNNAGENIMAPAFSPTGGAPAIQLNTDLSASMGFDVSELNSCIFAEPGLLATSTALYATIHCAHLIPLPITVYTILLKCTNPCSITDANAWEYKGRLLTPADATVIGHHHYSAPELVEKAGTYYLIATPVDTSNDDDRYDGCRVYQFTDLDLGILNRSNGNLVEVQRVDGTVNTHNGACSYHTDLSNGIMYIQADAPDPPEIFKIYDSLVDIP